MKMNLSKIILFAFLVREISSYENQNYEFLVVKR